MNKYLLVLFLAGALFCTLSAYPKKSLVERYTNSGCPPCKTTNDNWYTATTKSLLDTNSISHVVYNVSWPDPDDPMYLFNVSDNTSRVNYYGVNSVPWITVNGTTITLSNTSPSNLLNAVTAGNSQTSPFKIVLTSDFFSNNMIDVHVKVLRDPSDTNVYSNTKIKIALTERMVHFNSAPGSASNGERTFYSITRKMLPNAGGTLFNPPAPGDSTELDLFFPCSASFMQKVIMDSVRVVAFLQNDNTKFIYQSEMSNLKKASRLVTYTPALNMGSVEITNSSDTIKAVLLNWNTIPCIISNFTSQSGPFKLLDNLNYPVTIPVNDSLILHFKFTPSQVGDFKGYFALTSNDSLFKGITLKGRGFKINAAAPNTFYASSGSNNNGNFLQINPATGKGTNIGPSLYSELHSITADPKSLILYGISTTSLSTEFVRINPLGGDSYNLFTCPMGDMSSIAFDKNGILYAAMKNGLIYSVDLPSQSFTQVCSLSVKVQSIAFNPVNNELWGTYFAAIGLNRDRIFKINLSTGDTVSVGNTGTGVITNSIAFDNLGNLFGLTGLATQSANFISIDKNTGLGVVIGSTGAANLTGLCFSFTSAQGISDVRNIPASFNLMQNYPNPFNPSTLIRYSIPKDGLVKLNVYNSLGQKVAELVNRPMVAGNYEVNFNASNLSSGVYFYELSSNNNTIVKKLMLIK
jgi:hypothetical protein